MGLFRPARTRRGPDPYYDWKVGAFAVGAAFGLAGIFTNRDVLVLVAVPILAVGVALRWLPRRGDASADAAPDDREESAEHERDGEAPPEESGPEAVPPDPRSPPEDGPPHGK